MFQLSRLCALLEMLLGFLGYRTVEGPGNVLCHVKTKNFGTLDYVHRGSIDIGWRVFT